MPSTKLGESELELEPLACQRKRLRSERGKREVSSSQLSQSILQLGAMSHKLICEKIGVVPF